MVAARRADLYGLNLMTNDDCSQLVDELVTGLESESSVEPWLDQRIVGSQDRELLIDVYRDATKRLLDCEPPKAAHWESLLVPTAARSVQRDCPAGFDACRASVEQLTELVVDDTFSSSSLERIVAFASTLIVALEAQRKLRQTIEHAAAALFEQFPDYRGELAERCQDLWQRHGQLSREEGLFVWDVRNAEWRLSQDFKSHRPD